MKRKTLFFGRKIFLVACLILIISLISTLPAQEDNKKPKVETDEEAHFKVDVRYRIIDVVALDESGRHVKDLSKDDFILKIGGKIVPISSVDMIDYIDRDYVNRFAENRAGTPYRLDKRTEDMVVDENGFEVSVPSVKGEYVQQQPPRTFVIVFANLPFLPKRWFILRDGLMEYLDRFIGGNVQIGVYSMGLSKLGVIQPITSDIELVKEKTYKYLSSRWGEARKNEGDYNDNIKRYYDLDEDPDHFFVMSDTPDPDIDHTNSSWIISGCDYMVITKETVYDIFEQFDILVNRIREYPGKKNILLFSEGLPWLPWRLTEPIEMRDRRLSVVSRMNRHNISVFTFDLFTTRNMTMAGIRQGLLAQFSHETNGVMYPFLGNKSETITERLITTDVHTASYYLIGFYVDEADMESDSIDLEVDRAGVKLYFNRWLNSTGFFAKKERYLDDMEATRKLFNERKYRDLIVKSSVYYLPADDGETWVVFSNNFPTREMLIPEDEEEAKDEEDWIDDDLDATLGIELTNDARSEKYLIFKNIEYPSEERGKRLLYNYRLKAKPGLYDMRLMLSSRNNNKTATRTSLLNIPDLRSKEIYSIIFAGNADNTSILQSNLEAWVDSGKIGSTPFSSSGDFITPDAEAKFRKHSKAGFYAVYSNKLEDKPVFELLDSKNNPVSKIAVEYGDIKTCNGNMVILKATLNLQGLRLGKYKLVAKQPGSEELVSAEFEII
ncbi:MAG: hypothetical protein JW737_04670 [Acidobacteria bacterium]|nr:hypothetical protein [Acidobacteriota bacterium]